MKEEIIDKETWWQDAPYAYSATESMRRMASEGSLDKDVFIQMCLIISDETKKQQIDTRELASLFKAHHIEDDPTQAILNCPNN